MRKKVRKLTLISLDGSMPKATSMRSISPCVCQYLPFNNSMALESSPRSRDSLMSSSNVWKAVRNSAKLFSFQPDESTYCFSRSRCIRLTLFFICWHNATTSSRVNTPTSSWSSASTKFFIAALSSGFRGITPHSMRSSPRFRNGTTSSLWWTLLSTILRRRSRSCCRKSYMICKNSKKPYDPSERCSLGTEAKTCCCRVLVFGMYPLSLKTVVS
mmetsp:Transcript_14609/g.31611  ORF Transcript_14609/g.31611 Transcript_14609/m.31611 type:complete len:215 (+) Transcript_14609:517-1161(+)